MRNDRVIIIKDKISRLPGVYVCNSTWKAREVAALALCQGIRKEITWSVSKVIVPPEKIERVEFVSLAKAREMFPMLDLK